MNKKELENIEIYLLLEAIYNRYGYDFRQYTRASLKRRITTFLQKKRLQKISDMIPILLHNEEFFNQLIYHFSITVTEMFRDPFFYRSVRNKIIPYLKTYPFVKIWIAGCATGEEVYSLAIMLKEEGLYERCTIFATDFNDAALLKAKEGIYSLKDMKTFTTNYLQTEGKDAFSQYYYAQYESAIMDTSLKERITFANHNLVTDNVFGEMHLIFCRNVLIYFDRSLQNRVLRLFSNSLTRNGFLCLGTKETINFSNIAYEFDIIDDIAKTYQKKI